MKLQLILYSIHERYLFYCSLPGVSVFAATVHFKKHVLHKFRYS